MNSVHNHPFVKWKKTRRGLVVSGVVELVLAYLAGSWAIDSGSKMAYFITLILLIGVVQSFVRALKTLRR